MKRLKGITVAIVTPFDRHGRIYGKGISDLIEFLIKKEIDCFYPLGTTGEMIHLSTDERKEVAETVVREVNGRRPVFIHVGSMCQDKTVELARHAHAIGADGIGVVTPAYLPVTDREMEEYYIAAASSVPDDFPVYLYNIPQFTANDLKPEVAERIAEKCPNVIGIKYSYPDIIRTLNYLMIKDGDFSVLCGPDPALCAVLSLGCDGIVTGFGGVFPELMVAIYKAFLEKNFERAGKIQFLVLKACNYLKNGSNMAYIKEALRIRGVDAGYMRKPQLDLDENEVKDLRAKVDVILSEMNSLCLASLK